MSAKLSGAQNVWARAQGLEKIERERERKFSFYILMDSLCKIQWFDILFLARKIIQFRIFSNFIETSFFYNCIVAKSRTDFILFWSRKLSHAKFDIDLKTNVTPALDIFFSIQS